MQNIRRWPVWILGMAFGLLTYCSRAADPIRLQAADGFSGAAFGQTLAMAGGIAAIGAPGARAVYVYERGTNGEPFGLVNKLEPWGEPGVGFAEALGLDGDVLAVGAPDGSGSVYVFLRDSTQPDNWRDMRKLVGAGTAEANFGRAVAVSGNRIAVGAPGEDGGRGAIYVFERGEGGPDHWGQVARVNGSDLTAAGLGQTLALSGHTLAARATLGAQTVVYVFQWGANGNWTAIRRIDPPADGHEGATFGQALAATSDQLVIGSPGQTGPGAAYVHLRNRDGGNAWGRAKTLINPGSVTNDGFGTSVALFYDKIVVGSPGATVDSFGTKGKVFAFSRNQNGRSHWGLLQAYASPDGTPQNGQDFGRAISLIGTQFISGAPQSDANPVATAGAAYALDIPPQFFCRSSDLEGLQLLAASEDVVVGGEIAWNYFGDTNIWNQDPIIRVHIIQRDEEGSGWRTVQTIERPAAMVNESYFHFAYEAYVSEDTLVLVSFDTRDYFNQIDEISIYDRYDNTSEWRLTKTIYHPVTEGPDLEPWELRHSLSGDLLAVSHSAPPPDPAAYPFIVVTNMMDITYSYTGECEGVYSEPMPGCEDSLVTVATNYAVDVYWPCPSNDADYWYDRPIDSLAPYLDRIETNWIYQYQGVIQRDALNPLAAHKLVLIWTNEYDEVEYYYANNCEDEWPEPSPLDGQEHNLLRIETNRLNGGATSLVYIYDNQCLPTVSFVPIPGLESFLPIEYCGLICTRFDNELFRHNLVLATTTSTETVTCYYKDCCDEFPSEYRLDDYEAYLLRIDTNNLPGGSTRPIYVYSGLCSEFFMEAPVPGLESYLAAYIYTNLVVTVFPNDLFADHLVTVITNSQFEKIYFYADGCNEYPYPFYLGSEWDDKLLRIETNRLSDGSTNLAYFYADQCGSFYSDPIPGLEAYGIPMYTGLVVVGFANSLTATNLVLAETSLVEVVDYYYANGCNEFPVSFPLDVSNQLLRTETNSLPDGTTNYVYVYSNLCDRLFYNHTIPGLEPYACQNYTLGYYYRGLSRSPNPGEVYIYQRNAGGSNQWGLANTLKAPDGYPGDYFGIHVSLYGDTLFTCNEYDYCSGESNAWVYVFRRDSEAPSGWKEIKIFQGGEEPIFSLCGDTAIISDWQQDFVGPSVLERNAGGPDNWGKVMQFPEYSSPYAKLDNQRICIHTWHGPLESGWMSMDINDRAPGNSGTWLLTQSLNSEFDDILEAVIASLFDFSASGDGDLMAFWHWQFGEDQPDPDDEWARSATNLVSRIYELGSLPALAASFQAIPLTSAASASVAAGTDFGRWKEGSVVDRVFTLRNLSDCGDLVLTAVTTNGPGAGSFEVLNWPTNIPPGSTRNFTVRLHATAEGFANAFLRIESASPDSPFILNLQAEISGIHDVSEHLAGGNVNWVFNYVRGTFLGTLTLCLPETYEQRLIEPYWYLMESNAYHWLRFPTGRLTNGLYYLDLTRQVTNQLPGIGNGDAYLDAGECVTVTNIELMGRRDCTGFVWAVWADPPPAPAARDSDGDGLPDAYENSFFGLDPYNVLDAGSDRDRDGMTAWEEWVAGTDPSLAASVLAMDIRVRPDGGVDVTWPTVTGRTYVVETGLDRWVPLTNGLPAGTSALPDSGFFRIRVKKGTAP